MKNLLERLLEFSIFRIIAVYPIVCALVVKIGAIVLGITGYQEGMFAFACLLYAVALAIEFWAHIENNS